VSTIARLLVQLARDQELLERFQSDPDAVMSEFNLTDGQKRLIREGNLAKIRAAVDYEFASGAAEDVPGFGEPGGVAMVVTWRPPPGPEPTWLTPPPESY
jgi:hypothetical protein